MKLSIKSEADTSAAKRRVSRRLTLLALLELAAILVLPNTVAGTLTAAGISYTPGSGHFLLPPVLDAANDSNFYLLSSVGSASASYFCIMRLVMDYLAIPLMALNAICSFSFGFGDSLMAAMKDRKGAVVAFFVSAIFVFGGLIMVIFSGDSLGVQGIAASQGNLKDGAWGLVFPVQLAFAVLAVPTLIAGWKKMLSGGGLS